jgi:hypothetical protein
VKRRSFLKRGLLGGLLLSTAGGLGLALFPSRIDKKPTRKLLVLDERRFAVLAAVAARTVRAEGADPVEIAHLVDQSFSMRGPEMQKDFVQALTLLENALAGFLFDGRGKPFTRLTPEAQDAVLMNWRDSRLAVRRGGYKVLSSLTRAAYYAQPSSWAGVNYPGPPTISGQPT